MQAQCRHCGHLVGTFTTVIGGLVCSYCGERRELPAGAPDYARDKKLRGFAREAVREEAGVLRDRMTAAEGRIDGIIERDLERMGKEIKAERYEAWMGGVLETIPSVNLARELARRL